MSRLVLIAMAAVVLCQTPFLPAQPPQRPHVSPSRRAYSPPTIVIRERYGEITALAAYPPVAYPANVFDVPLPPWGYGFPYGGYPGPYGLGFGYSYGGFGWRSSFPWYYGRGYFPFYPYSYPWAGFGYYPGILGGYYGPYFGW